MHARFSLAGMLGALALGVAVLSGCPPPSTACTTDADCQDGKLCKASGSDGTGACVGGPVPDAGMGTSSSGLLASSSSGALSGSGGSSSSALGNSSSMGGSSSSSARPSSSSAGSATSWMTAPGVPWELEAVSPVQLKATGVVINARPVTTSPERISSNGVRIQGRLVPLSARSSQ